MINIFIYCKLEPLVVFCIFCLVVGCKEEDDDVMAGQAGDCDDRCEVDNNGAIAGDCDERCKVDDNNTTVGDCFSFIG
jgi:hypothetical protein